MLDTSSAPEVLFYQATVSGMTRAGFFIFIDPCLVSKPPARPVLISPPYGALVRVGVTVSWSLADFGANCAALLGGPSAAATESSQRAFQVLLRALEPNFVGPPASLDAVADVPAQADSGRTVGDVFSVVLSETSLEPNTTYAWAVLASNGVANASSAVSLFRTLPRTGTSTNPVRLTNGVMLLDQLLPSVPAAQSGTMYFALELDSPGGSLAVFASPVLLPVAGAPNPGSFALFALAHNASDPTALPSATSFEARSAELVGSPRQTLVIDGAAASGYRLALVAPSGAAMFALNVAYSCPTNSFLTSPTGTACTPCPANAGTLGPNALSVLQCLCRPGFFGEPGRPCSACPEGGICDGSTVPIAAPGMWSEQGDAGAIFYRCPLEQACVGGLNTPCRDGYAGRLCADCASGYYSLNTRCYRCPAAVGLNFFIGLALLALFLLLTNELARFYRKISSGASAINFVQTLAILPLYQLNWPNYLILLLNDCSGFNLNPELTAADCLFSMKWRSRWLFYLALPLAVAVAFVLVFGLARLVSLALCCSSYACSLGSTVDTLVPAFVAFLMFLYLSITYAVLSFFDCTKQPDGSYTLDASSDILCYSSQWYALLPIAIAALFFYALGIPLFSFAWLNIKRRQLFELSPTGDRLWRWLGPLYGRYKAEYYYWETLVFLRKAALLVVGAFLTNFPIVQGAMAVAVLGIALALQLMVAPHEYDEANTLDALLMLVLVLVFIAGLLFNGASLVSLDGLTKTLFALLVVLFAFAFLACLVVLARELRRTHAPVSAAQFAAWQLRLRHVEAAHVRATLGNAK